MNSGAKFEYLGYSPGVLQRLPASDRADYFQLPVFRIIKLSLRDLQPASFYRTSGLYG